MAIVAGLQAEVFCLRHLSDLSYEEISREMGVSEGAVGVLLHRARGRLRMLLAPNDVELDPTHTR